MSERDSWPDAPELAGPPGEEDEVEVEEAAEVELEAEPEAPEDEPAADEPAAEEPAVEEPRLRPSTQKATSPFRTATACCRGAARAPAGRSASSSVDSTAP